MNRYNQIIEQQQNDVTVASFAMLGGTPSAAMNGVSDLFRNFVN